MIEEALDISSALLQSRSSDRLSLCVDKEKKMGGLRQAFHQYRKLHQLSREGPSDMLRRKVAEMERKRKKRNIHRNDLYVDVPESKKWLDTASMPMILTAVGTALFAKILMMVLFKFYYH